MPNISISSSQGPIAGRRGRRPGRRRWPRCHVRGRFALELGLFERDAFQSCPGDHPKGLRVVGRQVVEVARKFGDGVRSDGDRTEELRAVGGDDLAEQRFLVAEVRVEALLAGVRRLGDPVDPGAGQAVTGELGARGVKDYVAQFGGISHSEIIAKRTSSFGSFG